MASIVTNHGRLVTIKGATGAIDLLADTIDVILLGTGYTPSVDHNFASDLTSELSGTGYASGFGGSGRKTLSSKALVEDDTNDVAYFDAADVTWTGINAGTIGYAAIVQRGASDAASPLIAVIDVADTVTNGGDITIQWGALGIIQWA